MPFLSLKHINKTFGTQKVLKDINLNIKEGEFISLLGSSGCGKSTLLRIIAGLEKADSGEIFLKKTEITRLAPAQRECAMVFQSYALFPHMSAEENLAFPLRAQGYTPKKIRSIIAKNFELVGLSGFEKKMPNELSGGQQQRVAIARALSLRPKLLLLDEPLSALDAKVRARLRVDIKALHRELGITSIMVTHDQEEAITMSDRIALMNEGKIVQMDSPYSIYQNPSSIFSAHFIGEVNTFIGKNEVQLLRPEHIHLHRENKKDSYKAVVQDIAFMGGFFKIILESKDSKEKDSKTPIICTIATKEFHELDLRIGEGVFFSFNAKYMLRYKADSKQIAESFA